jgi:type II secretory pathway pseudopilin PulG
MMDRRLGFRMAARRARDAGDTLVELLVALTILSLTVVAILGGLLTSTTASTSHRNLTVLDGILKSFADTARYQIETQQSVGASSPSFTSCSTTPSYYVVGSPYPSSGPPGTVVSVFGLNFTSTTGAQLSPAPATSPTFTLNPGGNASGAISTFTVPLGTTAGTYAVYPFDSSHAAAIPFTVTTGSYVNSQSLASDSLSTTASCPVAGNSNLQELDFQIINSKSGSAASDKVSDLVANLKPLVSTSTVVSPSPSSSVIGQPVTYTATVSVPAPGTGTPPSTDTVSFQDNGVAASCASQQAFNGSTASCTVIYASAGAVETHTITAIFSGDSTYAPSEGATTEVVSVAPTGTILVSSTNPVVTGQSTTLTATVAVTAPGSGVIPSSDTVSFMDGTNPISCGAGSSPFNGTTATCIAAFSTGGTHSLSANFSGDNVFGPSTSNTVDEAVNQAGTSTSVASSTNGTSVVGQQVTYTATVSVNAPGAGTPSSADTVSFKDGSSAITCGPGSQAFNGTTATCAVTYSSTAGSPHSITAVFGGDANYSSSTSAPVTQTVSKGSTATAVQPDSNPATLGKNGKVTVTYTATVTTSNGGSPTGTVTFTDGGTSISCAKGSQSFNGSTATCNVDYSATGSHQIAATYSGDTNFSGSQSPAFTETVQ